MQSLCLDISCADKATLRGKVEYALRICFFLHVAKCIYLSINANSLPLHCVQAVSYPARCLPCNAAFTVFAPYFCASLL